MVRPLDGRAPGDATRLDDVHQTAMGYMRPINVGMDHGEDGASRSYSESYRQKSRAAVGAATRLPQMEG